MSQKHKSLASLLLFLACFLGFGSAGAQAVRPCDIYASASPATPCVAAYSTARTLYGAYTGPLYQVTRASDKTATDVGVLSDGYANAAVQDTFCAGTTCTITKLYDQSSNHNDLIPAPPGQNGSGAGPNHYDLPASATALPIVIGGHKAYGILISPGMGYRNNAAKNIATGTQPEGVYMVSSALEVPTGAQCCFDFGNAENDNNDDGYGTMDAMNLLIDNTGAPAVGLDMENGVPGDFRITPGLQFLTAMGWNNGTTNFKLFWGDATTGSLTATIVRALPTQYQPMKKEGGIILGIGGDNSNYGPGYFFEGAMTSGTPADASMNAVQASIVAAGYAGPATLSDGGTYTFQNKASLAALDNSCDGCTGGVKGGVAVVQNPPTGALSQQWTVHAQGNGYFTMVSKQSGLCLDDPYGNGTPSRTLPQSQGTSTMLWQLACNGQTPQNWLFIPQSDGSYAIENQGATTNNAGNQMVIDVFYGQTTAGLQMWLDTANGLPPQKWVAAAAGVAGNLALSGVPPSVVAGAAQSLTIQAQTSAGAVIPAFTGTLHFTSTDPNAVLPADYTYVSADAGSHTFPVTLKSAGTSQCITVSDTADSVTSQVCTAVTAASASVATASAGNLQMARVNTVFAAPLQVLLVDAFGNPVSGVAVTFTPVASSGASASFSSPTVTSSSAGVATSSAFTANGTTGTYTVNATASGITQPVSFSLTNTALAVPVTVLTANPSANVSYGQSVTLSASVTSSGTTQPSGTVSFYDTPANGPKTQVGTSQTLASGKAGVQELPTGGAHTFAITYSGDSNFAGREASGPLTVAQVTPAVSGPASQPVSIASGQTGSIAVAVTGVSVAGASSPTGTLTYTVGSGTVQTAAVNGGQATLTLPNTTATGSYTISVSYGGDSNYTAATSSIAVTVTGQAQTITFMPLSQQTYGVAGIALSATASSSLPVTFSVTSGPATVSGSMLKLSGAGQVCVEADQAGNTTYSTATPIKQCFTVAPAASQTGISTSANPSNSNAAVLLTANLTLSGASLPTAPTGTVTFYNGTAALGKATTLSGSGSLYTATFSAAAGTLPVGSSSLSASYSGDMNYLASSSAALTQTVVLSTFTMTGTPTSLNVQSGQNGTVVLTLTSVGGYTSPVAGITFQCSPLPSQSSCSVLGASPVTLSSGASATVSLVIKTTGTTRAALQGSDRGKHLPLLALLPAGLLLPFAFRRRRRGGLNAFIALFVLAFVTNVLVGCGGASTATGTSQAGTPAGTTNVVISATDGTITQSVPVTLTVQ